MPRRTIYFLPGEYYHIYNRGAGRQSLFREPDNYAYVLRQLKKYAVEFAVAVIAYCLMPNHYHLLLRQDGNMAAGELATRIFGGYSRAVNKRYGWSGTLFEGRFQAKHVDSEGYLLHLCRYIHANPVKDGLCQTLDQWPYSNYREWVGLRHGSLVDREFVQSRFPVSGDYVAFVEEFLRMRQLPEELAYLRAF